MEIRDQNGEGEWSAEAILDRYRQSCERLGLEAKRLLIRTHTEGSVTWIFPLMDQVIDGIVEGDEACIDLGIQFIEQDRGFLFGRILKANTARALRRVPLLEAQRERIRRRIVAMFVAGNIPREFREYSKLLKQIGVGEWWPIIARGIDRNNKYALRYYSNLLEHASEHS